MCCWLHCGVKEKEEIRITPKYLPRTNGRMDSPDRVILIVGKRAVIDYNFYFCYVNVEIFIWHLIAEAMETPREERKIRAEDINVKISTYREVTSYKVTHKASFNSFLCINYHLSMCPSPPKMPLPWVRPVWYLIYNNRFFPCSHVCELVWSTLTSMQPPCLSF